MDERLMSGLRVLAAAGGCLLLAGCAENLVHLDPDFGRAVREQQAAQIADPDAAYRGDPAPASDGSRVQLAQDRYNKGEVTPPTGMATSTIKTRAQQAAPGN